MSNRIHSSFFYCAFSLLVALLLCACAHQPSTLYHWGNYQTDVYRYFQGDSPNKQIQDLEQDLRYMQIHRRAAPPGLHSYLGMLYAKSGNEAKAREQLLEEKALFPESSVYINLLLENH